MVNLVEPAFDLEGRRDVVLDVLETWVSLQMDDVLPGTRNEVVHADHAVPLREEPFAEMTSDESRPHPSRARGISPRLQL